MNFLALALIVPLAACSFSWDGDSDGPGAPALGSGTTRTYALANFSEIDLRGADDVDVRVGPAFSVRAEGPSEQLDRLRIEKDGDTLKVGRQKGTNYAMGRRSAVKVYVTLPRLAEAGVAGSGSMTVDRVEGGKFEGGIAGSGNLNIVAMRVEEAELSVAGSGNARLAGTARTLKVDIAGSGDVEAAGLRATNAEIAIAGSGSVRAVVDGPAKVDVMGSGDVDLGPRARCTVSKMGSGSVRCAN